MVKKKYPKHNKRKLERTLDILKIKNPKIIKFLTSPERNYIEVESFQDHAGNGSPAFTRTYRSEIEIQKAHGFETKNFEGAIYLYGGTTFRTHIGWERDYSKGDFDKNRWRRGEEHCNQFPAEENSFGIVYINKNDGKAISLEKRISLFPDGVDTEYSLSDDRFDIYLTSENWIRDLFIKVNFNLKTWEWFRGNLSFFKGKYNFRKV